MKTWECKECGSEIQSAVKPKRPCKCGARGKWKEAEKLGTPTTLREAIEDGMNPGPGSMSSRVEAHVRDFLAQKFGAAMLSARDSEVGTLQNLWSKIIDSKAVQS